MSSRISDPGAKTRRAAEDAALEAAARDMAAARARQEYGDKGYCFRVHRIADTRYFRAYIAHQTGKPGQLVGKTVTLQVDGWEGWFSSGLSRLA
ncbi:hypothetical protein GXW78_09830 [Roseomonas terrae]|uniref:Uncharacterized protein n=1 Tax=Neoroseomonas terrae TaxID=424799 RepID=A0ABS5EH31_9PROT|nr:hypothetical protein [Neoroseomonas terrae]MBR0649962.1 hypothetical protein [Neoroseomonas terrae]